MELPEEGITENATSNDAPSAVRLLTPAEASALLDVSERQVRNYLQRGILGHTTDGKGHYRILEVEVLELREDRRRQRQRAETARQRRTTTLPPKGGRPDRALALAAATDALAGRLGEALATVNTFADRLATAEHHRGAAEARVEALEARVEALERELEHAKRPLWKRLFG